MARPTSLSAGPLQLVPGARLDGARLGHRCWRRGNRPSVIVAGPRGGAALPFLRQFGEGPSRGPLANRYQALLEAAVIRHRFRWFHAGEGEPDSGEHLEGSPPPGVPGIAHRSFAHRKPRAGRPPTRCAPASQRWLQWLRHKRSVVEIQPAAPRPPPDLLGSLEEGLPGEDRPGQGRRAHR